jgi:hypothetical protein
MTHRNVGTDDHPLGPLWEYAQPRRPIRARLAAAIWLAVTIMILGAAASVTPDESGLGSHRQLGLAPCTLPVLLGVPCPTCGMTTAFAHTVRGEFLPAFHTQPAGFLLAILCAVAGIAAGWSLVTGQYLRINWYRIRAGWVAIVAIAIILSAWGYKLASGWILGTLPD